MNKVWSLLIGNSLAAISLYCIYKVGAFIVVQIEPSPNIESAGFMASVIMITMLCTGLLLRFDMRHLRRDYVRIDSEFHPQNKRKRGI
jgi:hypothetical protein